MDIFTTTDWIGVSFVILIMGMSKGGFPVSGIALPLLVLLWPEQGEAARSAVSFMLPLLCAMDLVGAVMYRKDVDWTQIRRLIPGMLAGVALASIFFVSDKGLAVSDTVLKFTIGILGLAFSIFHLFKKKNTPINVNSYSKIRPWGYGAAAGLTSTIAHAAGPVMQMYFLPCNLSKKIFAGTTVYFFLILNAVKLLPFALLGRFSKEQLVVNIWLLPLIPIGVVSGYLLVRIMKESHYTKFIHLSLAATSIALVIKAFMD